jgi:hypothetical protein
MLQGSWSCVSLLFLVAGNCEVRALLVPTRTGAGARGLQGQAKDSKNPTKISSMLCFASSKNPSRHTEKVSRVPAVLLPELGLVLPKVETVLARTGLFAVSSASCGVLNTKTPDASDGFTRQVQSLGLLQLMFQEDSENRIDLLFFLRLAIWPDKLV